MKIIDLFPPCTREECDQRGTDHKHILPHQLELIHSSEKYVAMVGGYGAGKTLPACVLGVLLSITVPGNMGIVLRRSLPKLHDSTERIFLEVLQRAGVGYKAREMRDGWPHRIILDNGSEVVFRETTDLGRFLGPEYGWFYIDEAQEEPEKTFKDLTGRLRLPRAQKYLKGFITTNPPHQTHWIAQKWPKPGAWEDTIVVDGREVKTSFRLIQNRTSDNPFLPPEYVADLMRHHSPAEVKRILDGQYGFSHDGKGVYTEQFDYSRHVGSPPSMPITVVRSWDFGYHCPVVLWSQMFKCRHKSLHWQILHEHVGKDIEAEKLADLVLEKTKEWFPNHPKSMIIDCGDRAGMQVNDKGPGPMVRLAKNPWNLRFRFKNLPDLDPGIDLIRKVLRSKCPCGRPLLVVHQKNRNVIDMLAGGYHYPKAHPGKEESKKPMKDGYYDNIADSMRYCAECMYRAAARDDDFMSELTRAQGVPDTNPSKPWAWMER